MTIAEEGHVLSVDELVEKVSNAARKEAAPFREKFTDLCVFDYMKFVGKGAVSKQVDSIIGEQEPSTRAKVLHRLKHTILFSKY